MNSTDPVRMPDREPDADPALDPAPARLKLGWQRVVLVCRQCQKRGSGPSKLKAKTVVAALRVELRLGPSRTRVATTGCLGPCPKKAITVASTAPGGSTGEAAAWAVADRGEARALGAALADAGPAPKLLPGR